MFALFETNLRFPLQTYTQRSRREIVPPCPSYYLEIGNAAVVRTGTTQYCPLLFLQCL